MSFEDLLRSTITVEPRTGQDGYGMPTYGTAVTVAARIVYRPKMVRSTEGKEVVSGVTAWVTSQLVTVAATDRITLPDATTPRILSVERVPDEAGTVYTKIYFGLRVR